MLGTAQQPQQRLWDPGIVAHQWRTCGTNGAAPRAKEEGYASEDAAREAYALEAAIHAASAK